MRYSANIDGTDHEVEIEEASPTRLRIKFGGQQYEADVRPVGSGSVSILIAGRSFDFQVRRDNDELVIASRGGRNRVILTDRAKRAAQRRKTREVSGRAELKAVMPGRVIQVLIAPGDTVEAHQGLLIIEAMKMENEIKAPKAGKVLEIRVAPGQSVEKGEILAIIE